VHKTAVAPSHVSPQVQGFPIEPITGADSSTPK
jgi:hypothetical protein